MKDMKGLALFIADIRACKTKEAEEKRINKELANIRGKFGGKKSLDGYNRKKYVSKLLFIFLLGNDLEFGHLEAVNLLSAAKFSEKQIGYLFVSVVISDSHDMANMIAEAVGNDLRSTKELHVCLALNCIANMGGKVLAEKVMPQVKQLLAAKGAPNFVRKKSSLAMLRLFRASPGDLAKKKSSPGNTEVWTTAEEQQFVLDVVECLMHQDLGVVMSVTSLIIAMALYNAELWAGCVPLVINRLHRLMMASEPTQQTGEGVLPQDSDYMYYAIPAPWLCVKLLRLLQIFDESTDVQYSGRLTEALNTVVNRVVPPAAGSGAKPKAQYTNANQAVFFEAVNLIAHYDSDASLELKAAKQLGSFFQENKPNVRLLALEGLSIMAQTIHARPAVKEHLPGVLAVLHESKDPTVQRRAVDVLYGVCDSDSVIAIVKDLLRFLKGSDYGVREEVVLKCAILAEKFAADYKWYVNVVLTLITLAGDHVAEEVWHRVLQVVVNRQDVQSHAAKVCYQAMIDPSVHEAMIKVGAYVLGEFGHLIANDPSSTPERQLTLLQQHYPMTSISTRCLLLTTFAKFANVFPELKEKVQALFRADNIFRSSHSEIQQRANEYFNLTSLGDPTVFADVFDEMPVYAESGSGLLDKISKGKDVTDQINTGKKLGRRGSSAGQGGGIQYEDEEEAAPAVTMGAAAGAADVAVGAALNNKDFLAAFQTSDSGKLFESAVLQVVAKLEVSQIAGTQNKARITLYYGNKAPVAFTGLTSTVSLGEGDDATALVMTAQELPPSLMPGAQVPQVITFDCMKPFTSLPVLTVNLKYEERPITLELTLPVGLNKFMAPHSSFPWDSAAFMGKWNAFPTGEVTENVLEAPEFTPPGIRAALTAFKLTDMPNIDPNPENMCCAAMLHCGGTQVGVLARVQTLNSKHAIKYTIRASNEALCAPIMSLLTSMDL